MILKYINLAVLLVLSIYLSACTSSSGSSSAGTQVAIGAAPLPSNTAAMPAGEKTFTNDLGDSITLSKAYLVISSATIENTCDSSFFAAADSILNFIIPTASAHTITTPTSTGEPYVINILGVDGGISNIGKISPPPADYCGLDVDISAADADTVNLPGGAGEPDMISKTLFLEGSYTLSSGATGNISMSTGATLINRNVLLSALLMISKNNLKGAVNIAINYDTWFNAVDLVALETETMTFTNPADTNVSQVLQNITNSIHQL